MEIPASVPGVARTRRLGLPLLRSMLVEASLSLRIMSLRYNLLLDPKGHFIIIILWFNDDIALFYHDDLLYV
jgi:hypothetical protein